MNDKAAYAEVALRLCVLSAAFLTGCAEDDKIKPPQGFVFGQINGTSTTPNAAVNDCREQEGTALSTNRQNCFNSDGYPKKVIVNGDPYVLDEVERGSGKPLPPLKPEP
jgi:hypothetical protein